jgi:hypothetical protein
MSDPLSASPLPIALYMEFRQLHYGPARAYRWRDRNRPRDNRCCCHMEQGAGIRPHWYPLALVVTGLPYAWLGAKLYTPSK